MMLRSLSQQVIIMDVNRKRQDVRALEDAVMLVYPSLHRHTAPVWMKICRRPSWD